jgi:hypothetical protein
MGGHRTHQLPKSHGHSYVYVLTEVLMEIYELWYLTSYVCVAEDVSRDLPGRRRCIHLPRGTVRREQEQGARSPAVKRRAGLGHQRVKGRDDLETHEGAS